MSRRTARTVALAMAILAAGRSSPAQPATEPAGGRSPGALDLTPTAFVQVDLRAHPGWHLDADDTRLQRDGFEFRRIRVGVDGRWKALRFEFSVDPVEWNEPPIQDAWVEWRPTRAVRLRGGQFKLPGGREYGTASRRLGFLERSPISESLAAGRDTGGQVELRAGKAWHAEVGLFIGDGQGREHRAGSTLAARLQWQPVASIEVGGYGSIGDVTAVPDDHEPNGFNGRATSSYRFFDRVYVQGRRTRLGGDAQWRAGDWRATAEVLRLEDERAEQSAAATDLPALRGLGVTAALRWQRRGPRAAVRYDRIAFDDTGAETPLSSVRPRATDLRARGSEAVTLNGGWRLSRWLLAMGEASVERYFEPRSAPTAERQGPYLTLGVRLQVEWPE